MHIMGSIQFGYFYGELWAMWPIPLYPIALIPHVAHCPIWNRGDGAHGQWGNSVKGVWGTGGIGHMGNGVHGAITYRGYGVEEV